MTLKFFENFQKRYTALLFNCYCLIQVNIQRGI